MCVDCILGVVKVHLGRWAQRRRVSATRVDVGQVVRTLHNVQRAPAASTAHGELRAGASALSPEPSPSPAAAPAAPT